MSKESFVIVVVAAIVVVFAIAIVAGYSWHEIVELIRKTAESIAGTSKNQS